MVSGFGLFQKFPVLTIVVSGFGLFQPFSSKVFLNMKHSKNDVSHSWKSDALINAADIISHHVSRLFRCFIIHGHVSSFFKICALTPIIKDQNGSKITSSNYRAIGISSLLMKTLDKVLLVVQLLVQLV